MVRCQERSESHHRRKEIGLDADVPIIDPYQEQTTVKMQVGEISLRTNKGGI
jgi:hypothetical protein